MVSIILRNKNESEYIGFTLQSICDYIPDAEVIVMDNNSTDDSLSVVSLFNDRLNISVSNINNYTPGKSINAAVKICSNETILVLSAHSQIIDMDLPYVVKELKTHAAVFGNQTPIYRGKKISKRYIWSHFTTSSKVNMWSEIEDRPFLHNAFCFYNKSDLVNNPFDETYSTKEDRYWAADILSNKKSYLYTPVIGVNHYYTTNGATWKGIG